VSTKPAISVVVPARNAAQSLPPLLDALAAQTAAKDGFELIVVDDGSTDATAEIVRSSGDARLVQARKRAGVAAARNLGIRAAGGELVAFVDADCVPSADWVERAVAAFDHLQADVLAGHIDVSVARPSSVALVDLVHYYDQERYAAEGFAATGNLWVRSEVFERAGMFDERLARGEDQEFVRRAVAAGARLRYAPEVRVSHAARGLRAQARRCFAIGTDRGLAGLRSRAVGGAYVGPERSRERLAAAGIAPTRARMLSIAIARNACVRLPMVLGALWSGLRGGRPATPAAAGSQASSAAEEAPPPTRPAAP
jgi:glycosyltransferase involved in cell wall biosynthesis